MSKVKAGEIYWVKDFPTTNRFGETMLKNRPAIIISNNASLRSSGICTVVPISSRTSKVDKTTCNVIIGDFLPKLSATVVEQIATISQTQLLGEPLGHLNEIQFGIVKDSVKRQLNL